MNDGGEFLQTIELFKMVGASCGIIAKGDSVIYLMRLVTYKHTSLLDFCIIFNGGLYVVKLSSPGTLDNK
jgi:hypothetical protein